MLMKCDVYVLLRLEKKSPKKVMGSDWQKRYCVLDEATHSLKYYKKEGPNEKESGSIDLLMVADILPYDKNSESNNSSAVTQTDLCRFNVDMGEGFKNFKFKAKTPGEAERWISQLSEWREYCLMNMSNV